MTTNYILDQRTLEIMKRTVDKMLHVKTWGELYDEVMALKEAMNGIGKIDFSTPIGR
jgi:hypothetical protein